jgi:acylglycerol lipase
MKKIVKYVLYTLIFLVVFVFIFGLILAFLPSKTKTKHPGISTEEAAEMRNDFKGAHNQFKTTDGQTLFFRRWDPDSIIQGKKDIAVLIFPGITAHSGAYDMAGKPISEGGYITFGLDYRGHGLSDGNRGDSPDKERWIADLVESVRYIKSLGYPKVIILGHSMGVASAICVADSIPDEISGLILLSGAYEGKKGVSKPPTLFQKSHILASSIFRPSYQVVEYYRDGMTGAKDPLFNFRYTLRFLTMLDVKQLRLPGNLNVPVLVGVGDKDELFDVDKVKVFYDSVPGNKKEFLIMKNTTHAVIPVECWEQVVDWLNRNFGSADKDLTNGKVISKEDNIRIGENSPEQHIDFISLFNGKDLTGWGYNNKTKEGVIFESFDGKTETGDNRFIVKGGILTANPYKEGYAERYRNLWTAREFPKDFMLILEFRASKNADSGIFLRGTQLQCRDYLLAGPYKNLKKYKAQDWNRIEVVVKNNTAHCTCNGELLEEALKIPSTGPIGIESDQGQMEYRNIEVKEL